MCAKGPAEQNLYITPCQVREKKSISKMFRSEKSWPTDSAGVTALATIELPVFLGMTPNVLVLVCRHTSSRCRISECGNQQGVSRHAAYLYDPHGQASLLRELLSYVPGRFRRLRKCRLQNLQLLGLDRRTRTPPL